MSAKKIADPIENTEIAVTDDMEALKERLRASKAAAAEEARLAELARQQEVEEEVATAIEDGRRFALAVTDHRILGTLRRYDKSKKLSTESHNLRSVTSSPSWRLPTRLRRPTGPNTTSKPSWSRRSRFSKRPSVSSPPTTGRLELKTTLLPQTIEQVAAEELDRAKGDKAIAVRLMTGRMLSNSMRGIRYAEIEQSRARRTGGTSISSCRTASASPIAPPPSVSSPARQCRLPARLFNALAALANSCGTTSASRSRSSTVRR